MRETNFIKQKKDKWIELERTIQQVNPDPDKLNELFVQITDDLSYSRTFYPNRSVRVYLNGLAQQIFYSIYKNKKSSGGKLMAFWTHDLPRIMYESRWELFLGMLLFWVPFIIGCLSGSMGEEEEFARQLLGDDYIDLTIANIQSGDPMAIYKDQSRITMFLTIYLNNLMVCLRYFMFGALFTIGSIVELVFFGLYVGSFQFFFYEQGELLAAVLGVWTHGSLEIPAAILAGVAGIVMGKGLVFPGTYSRLQAFLISARKGIKIMIGTLPLVLAAAFIESYITRLTDTPDILRASFIMFNLFAVLFYFVLLPYIVSTENFWKHLPVIGAISLGLTLLLLGVLAVLGIPDFIIIAMIGFPVMMYIVTKSYTFLGLFKEKLIEVEEERLQVSKNDTVRFDRIKTAGEIFKDTFVIYKRYLPSIIWTAFGTAALFIASVLLMADGKPSEMFKYPAHFGDVGGALFSEIVRYGFIGGVIKFLFETLVDILEVAGQFFNYKNGFISPYFIANVLVYTIISYVSLRGLKDAYAKTTEEFDVKKKNLSKIADFGKIAIIVIIMNFILLLGHEFGTFYFFYFLMFPFALLWSAVAVLEGQNIVQSFGRALQLLFTKFTNAIGLYTIIGIISLMMLALIYSPVMMFLLQNFGYNMSASQETMDEMVVVAITFIAQTMYGIITPLAIISFGVYYYSQVEIKDAKSLLKKIQLIGTGKRIRGLEREG
jgi:uncharacterized membrane protein SpoIIM required for sporulation